MGKRKREQKKAPPTSVQPSPTPAVVQAPAEGKAPARPVRRGRQWLFRLLALLVLPPVVLLVLEGILRLAGYGFTTAFFVPAVQQSEVLVSNPEFGRWVFPARMEPLPRPLPLGVKEAKTPGTCRIFVLGESAALGFPDPSTSVARQLEVQLRHRYPKTKFEVLNLSMVAINSHVIRQIASQCVALRPDYLVLLVGNNEVIGPYGVTGVLGPISPSLPLIHASFWVRGTRLGQWFGRMGQWLTGSDEVPVNWEGMATLAKSHLPADDPRLDRIASHFTSNLQAICDVGTAAGSQVLLCTVPVNLKDSSPFGSRHRSDLAGEERKAWEDHFEAGKVHQASRQPVEALKRYQQAEKLDDRYAELAFRIGTCEQARGETAAAVAAFTKARDLDTLRFRTDSRLNGLIRAAAKKAGGGVQLVEAEGVFAANGPPGEELFLEHVHFTFQGSWLLGRAIAEVMASGAAAALGPPSENAWLNEAEAAARLGHTPWHQWKYGTVIFQQLIKEPPFTLQFDHAELVKKWEARLAALNERLKGGEKAQSVLACQRAVEGWPDDWTLRMKLADLLAESGQLTEAEREYRKTAELAPFYFAPHFMIGNIQMRRNEASAAEASFRRAIQLAPHELEAQVALATALEAQAKDGEAKAILEGLVRAYPQRGYTVFALGQYLARRNRLADALPHLLAAHRLEPNNPGILVELGLTELRLQRNEAAIEHFEAALKLKPDLPDVPEALAELRKRIGRR